MANYLTKALDWVGNKLSNNNKSTRKSKSKRSHRRKKASESNYWQIVSTKTSAISDEKFPSLNAIRRKVNNSTPLSRYNGVKAQHSWIGKGGKRKHSTFTIEAPRKEGHCFARRK